MMGIVSKLILALAAPLLLTGCLWSPGKFGSTLMLQKNGRFVLDYRGEIVLQTPEDFDRHPGEKWDAKWARCTEGGKPRRLYPWEVPTKDGGVPMPVIRTPAVGPDGAPVSGSPSKGEEEKVRPCTRDEIAALKSAYEKEQAAAREKSRKEKEEMAKFFGIPGSEEGASRAFAEKLKKYAGWRAVTYRGNGVFDVDYHLEGQLTQDLVFPLMPDSQFLMPFITLRRRADGAVLVQAPALGTSSNPMLSGAMMSGMGNSSKGKPSARAQGRFTVVTDGEILTNNSEEGPQPHASGRQVHWDVTPSVTAKIPEMLVRL